MESEEMQNKISRSQPIESANESFGIMRDTLSDLFTHEDILKMFSRKTFSAKELRKNTTTTTTAFFIGNDNTIINSRNPENFIDQKLFEMKNGMLRKLEGYVTSLTTRYDRYIEKVKHSLKTTTNIINHIVNRDSQYFDDTSNNIKRSNSSSYMRCYACKNIFERLENILYIHEKLQSSIEQNFEILENFLDNQDLIYQPNPLQIFVKVNADKILESWLFSKINFEKMDLSRLIENGIPNNLKKLIFQDTLNKFSSLIIKKSHDYDLDKRLLLDNINILENLSFLGMAREDFYNVFVEFTQIEGMKLEKLKKMKIKGCTIEDLSHIPIFPNIQKISCKATKLRFKVTNRGNDFHKLKFLSLEKSNMNTKNFNSLLQEFASSVHILSNLQRLSLAGNNLTVIDFSPIVSIGKAFADLRELNMESNRISKFKVQNLACLPSIRMINLIENNFTSKNNFMDLTTHTKTREPSLLILMHKNFFVLNSKKNFALYLDYLIGILPSFDYLCKYLNISYIFSIFNRGKILDISLNSNIQISLKKLNLSFCSLDNATLINFLKNNSKLINLRKVDLSGNFLNDDFVEMYLNENCFMFAEKLEVINFSDNQIAGNNPLIFEHLAKSHKILRKIKLKNTPFELMIAEYLQIKENEGSDYGASPVQDNNDSMLSDIQFEYFEENEVKKKPLLSEPIDLLKEFIARIIELKKDLKLVLDRSLKRKISGSGRKSWTARNKELEKIIYFE